MIPVKISCHLRGFAGNRAVRDVKYLTAENKIKTWKTNSV